MKRYSPFKFKQFSVAHSHSAMKVGVDGVLIGCWTDVGNARSILDVGTGCGLIALIMAQRSREADIFAIEIDDPSADEANMNFANSPWGNRLTLVRGSFPDALKLNTIENQVPSKFDLIISNPPYFNSGITETHSPRERARHQGDLSPASLLSNSLCFLNTGGSLAMVIPEEHGQSIIAEAETLGYSLFRKCLVRGHAEAPFKRVLLQWKLPNPEAIPLECKPESLTLEISPGCPTSDYRALCQDFYLKF